MSSLIFSPVLLFLAILPFSWIVASLLQTAAVRQRFALATPLVMTGSALLIALIVAFLLYAALYLLSPVLPAHGEPAAVIPPWLDELLGPATLVVRLAPFLCLMITLALLALAVRQRFRGQWLSYVVALGYFSALALFFANNGIWSAPAAFTMASTALGLHTCLMRPGRVAWLICGIALGIAASSGITGFIYFLPFLAWFMDRDAFRAPLVILLAAGVTLLMLLLAVGQVPLADDLAALQAADGQGSLLRGLQNLAFLAFSLAPLLCFLLWQSGSVGIRSWFLRRPLVSAATVVAALLLLMTSAMLEPVLGAQYILPLLPAAALLTTFAVSAVHAYRPMTGWSVYGFWAPLAAFLVVAAINAGLVLYAGLNDGLAPAMLQL